MSFKSHFSRAVTGMAVAAVTLAAAAPAQAAELTLTYKCKYPLIGTHPVTVSFDRGVGGPVPGSPQPITAKITIGGNASTGLGLLSGVNSLGGQLALTLGLAIGGDAPTQKSVVLPFKEPRLAAPFPDPVVFIAEGPAIPISAPATVTIDELQPQIAFYNEAGVLIDGPGLGPQPDIDSPDYGKRPWKPTCTLDAGQNPAFPTTVPDVTPPSTPDEGVVTEADFTPTSIRLRWTESTDNAGGSGVKEYVVRYEDREYRVPAGTLSQLVDGLGAASEYFFTVSAVDNAGNESAPLELFYGFGDPFPDVDAPSNPPQVTAVPSGSCVALAWPAATDNVGVAGYDIYNGAVRVASVTGTSATVCGLTANTTYTFRVVAKDAAGNASTGTSVTVRVSFPPPPPPLYLYKLAGSATLKTLTKGTLPLSGSINAQLTLATGAFSADLVLNPTQGRLTALGFLPVTAKIGFVPSGKTTGSLLDGVLTTNSKVRIKVQEVKLFGAIPLAGGNNCQTKSLSDINLKSTQTEFSPLAGGPIVGTFKISDLNGCGALNGLVSPLTAGGGNAINLQLTPGS